MMSTREFVPDYRNFEAVMENRRPARLPLYEHYINSESMEQIQGGAFGALQYAKDPADVREFFRRYCAFFKEMTYDVVSYEVCIGEFFWEGNAICGGRGPVQTRADFEAYPWGEIPRRFRESSYPRFDALVQELPPGMKIVGGVGNGVFEQAEGLVGLEYLPFMQVDDPELYADVFRKIGDVMVKIWDDFLPRYGRHCAACRFGDDLGFRSSLLTNPATVREHILPQYKRVIDRVHAAGNRFLWHSCGCVFEVMEDVIALGIDAKHSNEDAIAPFETWIDRYGDCIGLVGGFDLDVLCLKSEQEVYETVLEDGRRYRERAKGYALGSGNSIPAYLPPANYLAMIRAAQEIRKTP